MLAFLTGCLSDSGLEWNQEQGYRWTEVNPGFWDETGFQKLTASKTGIAFVNHLSEEQIAGNRNLLNGSGVAAGDIDGDGLVDLYFARLEGSNMLYKNMGKFKFKDITELAGVAHADYYSTGVVFADVDGDEDLDLLVTSLGQQNFLYINDGQGHFHKKSDSGLGASRGSTTMALADIDGDNDLDLYVTNYKEQSFRDLYSVTELTLENIVYKNGTEYSLKPPFDRDYKLIKKNGGNPEARELGEMDELYINEGDGTFHKIPDLSKRFFSADGQPVGLALDWGLAAKFQDINGDLLPDLYVCNDFWTPDRVWINQGNGSFKAIDNLSIRKYSFSSMGVDFSDVNRDGVLDIFVTEMLSPLHQQRMRQFVTQSPFSQSIGDINHQAQVVQNTLQFNRGDNTYAETAYFSGVEATGWSWATKFLDVDLDGYEDILITTGNAYDFQDLDTQERLSQKITQNQQEVKGYILEFPRLELPNVAFQNNGDRTFSATGSEWGFDEKDISHGMAAVDLDNDGDLDLAVNRLNQQASMYENKTTASRIAVRLRGKSPNTQGIGAVVKLSGGPVTQQKQVAAGGDYVSGSDPFVMFAANEDNTNHTIEVIWPDGDISTIEHVKANTIYEIEESGAVSPVQSSKGSKLLEGLFPLFLDISDRLNHTHYEEHFDDFSIQPLLPVKLSQLGPGLSWIDFDRDGDDDLFIASGKGGKLGVLENHGNGTFHSRDLETVAETTPGDQTTILGWGQGNNTTLIVGRSNYEQKYSGSVSANSYTLSGDQVVNREDIPPVFSATGSLAAADYDGDGDLDLFAGGRFVPGHYPMDASSRLYINDEGDFKLDKINSEKLREVGLVTGAVFSDYDQDGDPDLLLSTEWGPVKLFRNINGEYQEITRLVGLDQYKGWWNGVAIGDFNSDGYPDIIATNMGLNSSYQLDTAQPLKIYYDDFDRDRRMEILEAYYDDASKAYVPRRQLYDLDRSIPAITRSIQTHRQFAQSSLQEVLGTELGKIPSKQINTLEHMLFINNKGDTFSARPLPDEAQWSTAFYAGVADYDNDGNEDLFLSQNFFGFPPMVLRQDAGRGLWLQGDGNGHLIPVPGHKTGIKVYGEQRGAALSDINTDGKVDLAVSQNGAPTKLYLNQSNKPGIRVLLEGPEENTQGIGSSLRIVYENGTKGPRREIQAGSGYWSQNSATQIMGTAGTPVVIEVKWFDGSVQRLDMTEGKREYRIQYSEI